jgi:hypothetical protein
MADEKVFKTYHAKVLQIGETVQITEKYAACDVEIQVGEESKTVQAPRWHAEKLQVGQTYEMTVEVNNFGEKIEKVFREKPDDAQTAQAPQAPRAATPTPTPTRPKSPTATPVTKPDFSGRWREWNMHARTAQMQATERVNKKVDLLVLGKLMNEDGEPFTKIKITTYDAWIQDAITLYWTELEVFAPQDIYGDLVESPVVKSDE